QTSKRQCAVPERPDSRASRLSPSIFGLVRNETGGDAGRPRHWSWPGPTVDSRFSLSSGVEQPPAAGQQADPVALAALRGVGRDVDLDRVAAYADLDLEAPRGAVAALGDDA